LVIKASSSSLAYGRSLSSSSAMIFAFMERCPEDLLSRFKELEATKQMKINDTFRLDQFFRKIPEFQV
jgi:hypothetical protein